MNLNNIDLIAEYQSRSQNKEYRHLFNNPLISKDIWHAENDLGLKVLAHQRRFIINFTKFSQEWLKLLVKVVVLVKTKNSLKLNTIIHYVMHLKKFSIFLEQRFINEPIYIDNQLFEDFESYLRSTDLAEQSIYEIIQSLCTFFDTCRLEGWLDINTYWFKSKNRSCKRNRLNHGIKYIPEEVWNQLDQNLHYLPEPLQRMVLIIRSTGIRIGELCNMPFDCLRQRKEKWHLRFLTEKYNVEDELPIVVPELVAVIQEQQEYIRKHLGEKYDKLFCANKIPGRKRKADAEIKFTPKPRVMQGKCFNIWLNRLATKCDIRSKNGEIWNFQSHQFRRTVATVMENSGIRNLIIQKYLRHRSIDMQLHYTHILETVLKEDLEVLMREKKYVDHSGQFVASYKPQNPITEVMRQKMYQITTQYGECHRPTLKTPCPTVNACWQCQEWRTSIDDLPYLKEDLKLVEEELKIATKMEMVRQQQGLQGDRQNLLNRINGLEKING